MMKKFIIYWMIGVMFFLSGCSVIEEIMNDQNMNKGEELIKSSLQKETNPQIEAGQLEALSFGNTNFGLEFYKTIKGKNENIIFSPLSISLALSMTMAGAETSTEEAMMNTLGYAMSEESVHPAFNALLMLIEESEEQAREDSEGNRFQLNIANSIWGQSGYDFKQTFLDTLAKHYGAGIYGVNFKEEPEDARIAINDWVEDQTEDKIKDLIPPGGVNNLTRLVLANAIYFNGSWLYTFSETGTEEAPFTLLDGSEVEIEMMKLYGETLLYGSGDKYQSVILPYLSSDFEMFILVPDLGAFNEVENSLFDGSLDDIFKDMSGKLIDLRMPKFDFETTINATEPLRSMGMSEAFQPEAADFSGITESENLYITDVLHKATITVDEYGTEAAAATAVIVGTESAEMQEPISLIIDRPFIFMIRHRPTNSILFMGRVLNP